MSELRVGVMGIVLDKMESSNTLPEITGKVS